MSDKLGDKLKAYEDKTRLVSGSPIIARLDGVNFHTWTKGLERPYDENLSYLMQETAKFLARETNALAAYTQSDEISLTWYPKGDTEPIFGGKIQKAVSILASMCAGYFNVAKYDYNEELASKKFANFDCRIFQIPDTKTGGEYFAWRQLDARKNAVSMAAHHFYSHKELQGKSTKERLEMFNSRSDIPYTNLTMYFRHGTFILQRKEIRKYNPLELKMLPDKHEARWNPELEVERTNYIESYGPDHVTMSEYIYG